ncbi:MAG: 50S ribosomal protein L21 [Bacteroidota bacterium]
MYAIVNIKGHQFKVETGQKLYVNRMAEETGSSVELGEVLLLDNEGAVSVGKPFVEGASVTVKVLDHLKDDKVIVFKKKRRKGYKVRNGHRQALSQIEVESIQG